jgi:hypothetical protein
MRNVRNLVAIAFVALLAIALATPAAARPRQGTSPCKILSAEMQTWYAEEGVEIGWVSGTIDGGVYLRFDDESPWIDPATSKPNLVFSMKEGEIALWMAGKSEVYDGIAVRQLKTMQAIGSGVYANLRFDVNVYGKCVLGKGGSYTIEGFICMPSPPPPKK